MEPSAQPAPINNEPVNSNIHHTGNTPPESQLSHPSTPEQSLPESDDKDFVIAFLLSWLLGTMGADRFYLGKIGTGILKLITFGGFGIWYMVDLVLLALGKFKDEHQKPLKGYEKNKTWVRIITFINLGLVLLIIPLVLFSLTLTSFDSVQQKARDTERKTDINVLQNQLEVYLTANAKYPTLANINDPGFRAANLKGLDPAAMADPNNSSSEQLCATSTLGCYGYVSAPLGCDNGAAGNCTSYTLTATLESAGVYIKTSLN